MLSGGVFVPLWDPFGSVVPVLAVPGGGWVADDGGLDPDWAAPRRVRAAEWRRLYMDFGGLAEVLGGDALAVAAVAAAGPAGARRLTAGRVAVAGTRVEATVGRGAAGASYTVAFTATTARGSVLVRRGVVWVAGDDE